MSEHDKLNSKKPGDNNAATAKNANERVLVQDTGKSVLEAEKQSSPELKEVGGPKGLEPTRYGDWESKGRCYDF